MWQALASSNPPPTTAPCKAAITGTRPFSTASRAVCHMREWCTPSPASRSCSSDRYRPAQKWSPSPSITAARASGGRFSKTWRKAKIRPSLRALRFCGRRRRTTATAPRISRDTASVAGGVLWGLLIWCVFQKKGITDGWKVINNNQILNQARTFVLSIYPDMQHQDLIAIDIHTHAEVSCWNPFDNYGEEYDRAADKYFGSNRRPTIDETVAYYREKKIGLVMFTVDSESQLGRRRIPNEEICEAAQKNSDMMVAFASIDPHKGKLGAREARRLIEDHGVKGFKFHPTVQGFLPYDKMAWPIYEVIAEYKLPAIFHSGHSGIGSGMRCGGGLRLQNSNPMLLEDVAIDFPDIQIVVAHPSRPWQDEGLSLATHKPNVWIDLSGWSPKYFPRQLVQYANTLLKDRVLFGSDYPLITPERWMKDFEVAGFKPEVMPGILKGNAVRLLDLA